MVTLLSAYVTLCVVVWFSTAFAFAAAFAVAFSIDFALAFAFAFSLAYVIHFQWICFSEIVHVPRLVRVQLCLDDRPQLVVVTLKLLRVHKQMDGLSVSVGPRAAPQ